MSKPTIQDYIKYLEETEDNFPTGWLIFILIYTVLVWMVVLFFTIKHIGLL